jgi:hypothetical protein
MIGVRVRGLAVPPRPPGEAEHQIVNLIIAVFREGNQSIAILCSMPVAETAGVV